MRYNEIFDEYQIIPNPKFTMPNFSKGKNVGNINTGAGPLEVWKIIVNNEINYAAIDPKKGPKKPVAYLGFIVGTGLIMAKNALTNPAYKRKSIISELFLFVNQIEKHKILSDIQLTIEGEALWNSLIQSNKFNAKILYSPTSELFDLSDVGNAKTSDGEIVQSPKNDTFAGVYDSNTGNGQRFFYLLENHDKILSFEDAGNIYNYNICESNHRHKSGGLLQSPRYFANGSR